MIHRAGIAVNIIIAWGAGIVVAVTIISRTETTIDRTDRIDDHHEVVDVHAIRIHT